MNLWFVVILIIAIAVVLGPISMLRPSPAQKRKEALRLNASHQGVRFSMRRVPALKTDLDQPPVVPVYFLPPSSSIQAAPDWMLVRTHYEHEGNFYKEWDWQNEVRPGREISELLLSYLPELPSSIPAIIQGRSGTCIFWSEQEGHEVLQLIIELLLKLDQLTLLNSRSDSQ